MGFIYGKLLVNGSEPPSHEEPHLMFILDGATQNPAFHDETSNCGAKLNKMKSLNYCLSKKL